MQIPYRSLLPQVHSSVFLAEHTIVAGDVHLEENVNIWYGVTIRADLAAIVIGRDTNVQERTVIHVDHPTAEWDGRTVIGNEVTIGHRALLHSCRIGDRCLIGMGAIILSGAEIGEGSIVGAGAVVREGTKIPPRSLVVGLPAIIKGTVSPDRYEYIRASARRYVELAQEYKLNQKHTSAG